MDYKEKLSSYEEITSGPSVSIDRFVLGIKNQDETYIIHTLYLKNESNEIISKVKFVSNPPNSVVLIYESDMRNVNRSMKIVSIVDGRDYWTWLQENENVEQ